MRRSIAVQSTSADVAQAGAAADFRDIPLSDIYESESLTNPRATFDPVALEDLAASIRRHGVLQAILLRPRTTGDGYELIAGGRRLRAAQLAEIATIPARVAALDDQAAREAAIIENLQREEIHPLEEAEAYERLMTADPLCTADVIATKVGKSPTYVYSRLILLRLVPEIRDAFRRDVITAAHAQRLATVPADRQLDAFKQCFFTLLTSDEDGQLDRNNLAPMKQLDEWLRNRVALDVHHEDTTRFLPDLAVAVTDQEQAGAHVLALSTLTYHTDAREPKPILARSWKLADGKHTCPHARAGVIVLGDDRGRLVHVCIEKKQCAKHWGKPTRAPGADCSADDTRKKADAERAARERERLERDRQFWEQQFRPALLAAIAKKAAQQKTATRPLITAVLDALTHRNDDLETWCGPIAKLSADRFPSALIIALALREQFSQERLMVFAKSLRVDVPALRKQLKAARAERSIESSE